jgi:hypothetical protein
MCGPIHESAQGSWLGLADDLEELARIMQDLNSVQRARAGRYYRPSFSIIQLLGCRF